MTIYHVRRDYRIPLSVQKDVIRSEFRDVTYISSDGKGTITVFAAGRKEK